MLTEDGRNRGMSDNRAAQEPDVLETAETPGATGDQDPFLTTVEQAASGLCHVDRGGRFLYVNPALCHLLGYSREELLARSVQDITYPDDVAKHLAHFRRLLAGEISVYHLEQRYFRRDGSVAWVRATVALHPGASGAAEYAIATVEDITGYKQLESQLRVANERLAQEVSESQQQANDMTAAFDAITDLVVIFDAAGHVRRANRAVLEYMEPQMTMEAGRQNLHLTNVDGSPYTPEQAISARILRGETITGPQAMDAAATMVTGQMVLLNMSGAPVRDAEGQVVGGVLVLRDVTERRKLEQRTQESLDALLDMAKTLVVPPSDLASIPPLSGGIVPLLELSPVVQRLAELAARMLGCLRLGIVEVERGGGIMHPAALVGLSPKQATSWCAGLEGQSLSKYAGPDRMRDLEDGKPVLLDLNREPLRHVARGGPVALAVPLRLNGQLLGAMALGYEQEPHEYSDDELRLAGAVGQLAALIIERERLLREREEARASTLALQEANRRMDEFLGIAGHELRTPLTALLANVQALEQRLARTSLGTATAEDLANQLRTVVRLLGKMDSQGKRLDRLVSDLVDASRIRAGKLELSLKPCDLGAIVREMVEEQRQAHPQRVIGLTMPGDPRLPVVVDADRVGQVITNYLTNALKYSREEMPVAVDVRVEGETARVTVHDQGPGLPLEEQSQVWELFHRVPNIEVQSGSGIGLGLGLHICKTIIERHNGHVGVKSAVGKGSAFWFTLPLAPDAGASVEGE